MEGDGEKKADGDSHEDAKQFVVGVEATPVAGGTGDENWEGEVGSDALGSGHLEADRPEHDEDAEGEDDLALDTIGLLVVDGASVNEAVEEESDGESKNESTEEAVEDFEDARATEGVGIAPLDALKLELEKKESQAITTIGIVMLIRIIVRREMIMVILGELITSTRVKPRRAEMTAWVPLTGHEK